MAQAMRVQEELALPGEDQDLNLVRLAKSGDRSAFEVLYKKYAKKVFNLIHRMVGAADAEAVTQEAFFQVYKSLKSFQGRSQFYTWCYRIATDCALQHIKKLAYVKRETSTGEKVAMSPDGALDEAIRALPANQRVVMVLGPVQGHSCEEMAFILGTTEDVVKGRLHRARENVRAWLECRR